MAKAAPTSEVRKVSTKSTEPQSGIRLGTAALLFFGTFLGSLIGAAGDFSQLIGSLGDLQAFFNPPPELCIVGSNTVLGEGIDMAAEWEQEFEASHPARVRIEGIGSTAGVQRAADGGCAHILAMSEPITSTHIQTLNNAGIELDCAAEIGYDVIAFVTDIRNPVGLIPLRTLRDILVGGVVNWSQGNMGGPDLPIYILARPGSGTTEVVLINVARFQPSPDLPFPGGANYLQCQTNDACLDMTLSTRGSLYWVSTAWMRTQPPQYLRVMPILRNDEAPVNPLETDIDLNGYPRELIRPLYLYVLDSDGISDQVNGLARDFLAYVRGVRGQTILESHHFYTHFNRPTEMAVPLPEGFSTSESGPATICR
jgi:ABC-type phosphate transport system substrate-binding protein